MSTLDDDIARGCLENGEPIEAKWDSGWWSVQSNQEQQPEPEFYQMPCPKCGCEESYRWGYLGDANGELVYCKNCKIDIVTGTMDDKEAF